MISFPNCKINLGLNVVSRRADNYHNLETVFYPVQLKDALEITSAEQFNFQLSGLSVNGSKGDNLCAKAYWLLKADYPQLPPINMHLHKSIPMGAGLGGGSSDGAFVLKMLNKDFSLQIPQKKLQEYALQLGSDCPFFIINTPCFATARGEELFPVELDLSLYTLVLINSGIHVSTKEAFSNLTPATPEKSVGEIVMQPIETWKSELTNDFEKNVFELYPKIKAIKEQLYAMGAIYASMTGSGSTVFGLFEDGQNRQFISSEAEVFILEATRRV